MLHPQSVFGSDGSTLTLDRAEHAAAEPSEIDPSHRRSHRDNPPENGHAGPQALVLTDPHTSTSQTAISVLRRHGYTTRMIGSADDARAAIDRRMPDLALLDAAVADGDEAFIDDLRRGNGRVQVIVIDRDGAADRNDGDGLHYLSEPIDADELDRLLRGDHDAQQEHESARPSRNGHASNGSHRSGSTNGSAGSSRSTSSLPQRAPVTGCGSMVGESQPMCRIYQMIEKVAPTDATVIVAGESGTGKELVAQAIHQRSKRANRPFVAINCGAIPDGLIDSELFGHEKGAFTGATRARGGVFEQAHGGTLFLDEITEMPIDLQARLLRVLETGKVHRVGSERDVTVDVRVISASNRPPAAALEQGRLREDLLYRLSVFPIQLPPLRERDEDAVVLANHFLAELNEQTGESRRFSKAALELIRAYHWPGNVRQLMHAVHRAFIMSDGVIEADYLPAHVNHRPVESDGKVQLPVGTSVAEAEQQLIQATLDHYNNDKKKAADVLGMSLRTLYNRLNIYKAQERERGGKSRRKGRGGAKQRDKDFLFT